MSNPYAPPPPGHTAPPRREPHPGPGPQQGPGPQDSGPQHGPGGTPGREPGADPGRRPEPGPRQPPPPPVDPEAARAATRRVMHFALMMFAALVTGTFPLPWQLASFAFALGAVVMGARALLSVRRSGLRGGIVAVLAAGVGFSVAMLVSLVAVVALWPAQMELQDCQRDALTISAQERCQEAFDDAVSERLQRARTPGGGQG